MDTTTALILFAGFFVLVVLSVLIATLIATQRRKRIPRNLFRPIGIISSDQPALFRRLPPEKEPPQGFTPYRSKAEPITGPCFLTGIPYAACPCPDPNCEKKHKGAKR